MASIEGICNRALVLLGTSQRLTTYDDNSVLGELVRRIYDDCRLSTLEAHNWNFSSLRVQLARMTATPAYEFAYYYELPAGHIRTIEVRGSSVLHHARFYREEAYEAANEVKKVIATDETAIYMRYVSDTKAARDPNRMQPLFREALSARLAMEMALSITEQGAKYDAMQKLFKAAIMQAASIDTMNDGDDTLPVGEWVAARYGSYLPRVEGE